jgi:hypothetical protein
MAVGTQTNEGNVNQDLTNMAVATRDLATLVLQKWAYYNKLGLAGLEGLGFSAADAQAVLDTVNHMATPFQVYRGTVQAGGTGGTGAVAFNYEDYLTPLWGGQ